MRVLVNMAASIDGKINPEVRHGPFAMSRHPLDHQRMRDLRARTDATIIGASNLRADDPNLAPAPLGVVVTRAGEGITGKERIFARPTVIAHAASMPEDRRARLAKVAELVALGDREVDIPRLLAWLEARGCTTVLCEGGGVLNAAFFAARAVDELYLTLVPRVLGGTRAPTAVAGPGFAEGQIPDARLASCEQIGDELFLRYEFRWALSAGARAGT
jgi:riboflavin-specific deaminase-like protein